MRENKLDYRPPYYRDFLNNRIWKKKISRDLSGGFGDLSVGLYNGRKGVHAPLVLGEVTMILHFYWVGFFFAILLATNGAAKAVDITRHQLAHCEAYNVKADTFAVVPYGNGGLNLPPKDDFGYMGPRAYDTDGSSALFIYESIYQILYRIEVIGSRSIETRIVDSSLQDISYWDGFLWGFDGTSVHKFNATTLENLDKWEAIPPDGINRISGLSFFYKSFLFVQNVSGSLRPHFVYVYDLKSGGLSQKFRRTDYFVPIPNCSGCNFVEVEKDFFDRAGYKTYLGQSERFVLGIQTERGAEKYEPELVMLEKNTGHICRLLGYDYDIDLSSVTPVTFVNDSVALIEDVVFEGMMPSHLVYRRAIIKGASEEK